jgi:hypothetical protein
MNPARPLARWWALPARDRILFALLLAFLPLVSSCLRVLGYRRTLALIEARSDMPARRTATTAERDRAHRLATLLSIAGRRGLRATCLPQAMLLHLLLRRRGLDPQLKLGVRRTNAQPDMHAWVELEGDSLDPARSTHVAFNATSPSDGQPHD